MTAILNFLGAIPGPILNFITTTPILIGGVALTAATVAVIMWRRIRLANQS